MKLKMGLIGLAALAMAGCNGNDIPSYLKPKLEIGENGIKIKVFDFTPEEYPMRIDRQIEFTRHPEYCDSIEISQHGRFNNSVDCIKDGNKLLYFPNLGQELWIFNYENGKDTLHFVDYNSDWHVDRVYNARLMESVVRTKDKEEFFKAADEVFYNALDRVMQEIDIYGAIRKFNALPKHPDDFFGGNK